MTTLDEHRIERMRSVVMDAVDADVLRRGRRARVVVRTGAALCAVAIVAGVGAQFVGRHDGPAQSTASAVDRSSPSVRASPSKRTAALGSVDLHGAHPAATYGAEQSEDAFSNGRSVITTGSAHLLTTTPLNTSEKFMSWVQSHDGRIDGQSDTGVGRKARVTLTVRVPNAQSAIARLRTLGKLDQVTTSADDVTTQVTDLSARIKETRISITRLEAILAQTSSVSDVLTAESALTTRQQQLESMVEQQKNLSNRVALATITVSFSAAPPAQTVIHHPGWFHRALHKFDSSANAVLDTILYVVPWLAFAGVLLLLWAGAARLARRRRS